MLDLHHYQEITIMAAWSTLTSSLQLQRLHVDARARTQQLLGRALSCVLFCQHSFMLYQLRFLSTLCRLLDRNARLASFSQRRHLAGAAVGYIYTTRIKICSIVMRLTLILDVPQMQMSLIGMILSFYVTC